MTEQACTKQERELLDILKMNLSGRIYVERDHERIYEKSKITGHNFHVSFGGGGGPEPEWVYAQPRKAADALIKCVQEWGSTVQELEVNDDLRRRN